MEMSWLRCKKDQQTEDAKILELVVKKINGKRLGGRQEEDRKKEGSSTA